MTNREPLTRETMRPEETKPKTKRDPAATKERILRASMAEFGSKGYGGARAKLEEG